MEKPNCYKCVHRMSLSGSAHSRCNKFDAKVEYDFHLYLLSERQFIGDEHGIRQGWFRWPLNFDPVWLVSCDGFSKNPDDKKPKRKIDPLSEILSILR